MSPQMPIGHEPRVSIEAHPEGAQVTRIIGCSCGWQVPPGTTDADTAITLHAATAASDVVTPDKADMRDGLCPLWSTAPDDPKNLQHDLVQRAIDHVLSDREADQRSAELTRVENAVAAHLHCRAGQPPNEEAPTLLQNLQRAQAIFHLADQRATRCHEALKHVAQQLVSKLETSPSPGPSDDLLLVTPDDLPLLEARFLAEAARHIALGTLVLELDGTRDEEALDWLARFTRTRVPSELRLSRYVIVVIPPSLTPDRETRDRIVRSGGMPLYAPRTYSAVTSRDVRRRVLRGYLEALRTVSATSANSAMPCPEELKQTARRPAGHLEGSPDRGVDPSSIDLWRAINAYTVACGGDPSHDAQGNLMRQAAVVEIERHFNNRRSS